MTDDGENSELPLINTEKAYLILSLYKVPLIFFLLGLGLFALAFMLLLKNQSLDQGVVFTSEASSSAVVPIRVDIEGAVMKPGVYTLPADSRILDGLAMAGGLSEKADREYLSKNFNKAAKLVDGSKIYIPAAGETDRSNLGNLSNLSKVAGVTTGTININSASQSQLEALPGVGPVTAGKIISGRPYQSIEELKTRKILGTSLFEKLKDLITVY